MKKLSILCTAFTATLFLPISEATAKEYKAVNCIMTVERTNEREPREQPLHTKKEITRVPNLKVGEEEVLNFQSAIGDFTFKIALEGRDVYSSSFVILGKTKISSGNHEVNYSSDRTWESYSRSLVLNRTDDDGYKYSAMLHCQFRKGI